MRLFRLLLTPPSTAPFFQGAPKGRQQKGETGPRTHIFADFCRFSLISARSVDQGIWESQICRKPQIFAGNRRKPQISAETGFSHVLSPFWRAPIFCHPLSSRFALHGLRTFDHRCPKRWRFQIDVLVGMSGFWLGVWASGTLETVFRPFPRFPGREARHPLHL